MYVGNFRIVGYERGWVIFETGDSPESVEKPPRTVTPGSPFHLVGRPPNLQSARPCRRSGGEPPTVLCKPAM